MRTSTDKINYFEGILLLEDPYGAVSMIGDSGASLFCRGDQGEWINVGTVSAHGWDNETIIAPNYELNEMRPTDNIKQDWDDRIYRTVPAEIFVRTFKIGTIVEVLPFSPYLYQEQLFNSADRFHSRFTISNIEAGVATGKLDHYGPANYYLCGDQISCEDIIDGVKIDLRYLTTKYEIPPFLELSSL